MENAKDTKYKILFLDDDEFVTDMYSHKFSGAGHDFHAVSDAESALEELRNGFEPDAIVTDLIMPKIDGFGFLKLLKEEDLVGNSAVIVLSNQGETEDLTRARELGAIGHIIKANTIPTEVLGIITELIRKHKSK
mgnify:CR=1 FL=1